MPTGCQSSIPGQRVWGFPSQPGQSTANTSKSTRRLSTQVRVVFLSQIKSPTPTLAQTTIKAGIPTLNLKAWFLFFNCNSGLHIYPSNPILFLLASYPQLLKSLWFGFQSICFPSHFMLSQHLKSIFSVFIRGKNSSLLLLGTIILTVCTVILWYPRQW